MVSLPREIAKAPKPAAQPPAPPTPFRIEFAFLGALALLLVSAAAFNLISRGAAPSERQVGLPSIGGHASAPTPVATGDLCSCFDEGFALAGAKVSVLSSQYRTGFEQCRAMHGVSGGDAWTAGWNSRLSAKPYEASCRSYLRRSA